MRLLRRFLVLLMKRIFGFIHGQQLTVPSVLLVCAALWIVLTGRWSLEILKANPWDTFFAPIAAVGIFAIVMIVLAARDLNRELLAEWNQDKPRIIAADFRRPGPRRPGFLIGLVFAPLIFGFEALAFRAAYPSIPLPPNPSPPSIPTKDSTDPKPVFRTNGDDLSPCQNPVGFSQRQSDIGPPYGHAITIRTRENVTGMRIYTNVDVLPDVEFGSNVKGGISMSGPPMTTIDIDVAEQKLPRTLTVKFKSQIQGRAVCVDATASREIPKLSLVRFQPEPYEIDKNFKVRVYLDNKGSDAVDVLPYGRSEVVDNAPIEYGPRKALEDQLRARLVLPKTELIWMSIPVLAPGSFSIGFEGSRLSSVDVDKLGKTASVYFTGQLQDRSGRILLDFCFRTVPTKQELLLCTNR